MTLSDTLEGRLNFERHLRTETTQPESLVAAGASLGKMVVSTDPKHLEAIVGDCTALKERPGTMVSISTLEPQKGFGFVCLELFQTLYNLAEWGKGITQMT